MSGVVIHREAEVEEAREYIVQAAIKYGIISTGLAAATVIGLSRVSPLINNITLPGKCFIVSAVGVAGSSIAAEKRLLSFRNEKREARMHLHPELANREISPHTAAQLEKIQNMSAWDALKSFEWKHWMIKNKYYIVGGIWAASMAGSLGVSFANPHLKFSQKLIHARMYSQGITIAAVVASAIVAPIDHKKEEQDALEEDKHRFDNLQVPVSTSAHQFTIHEIKTKNHNQHLADK